MSLSLANSSSSEAGVRHGVMEVRLWLSASARGKAPDPESHALGPTNATRSVQEGLGGSERSADNADKDTRNCTIRPGAWSDGRGMGGRTAWNTQLVDLADNTAPIAPWRLVQVASVVVGVGTGLRADLGRCLGLFLFGGLCCRHG